MKNLLFKGLLYTFLLCYFQSCKEKTIQTKNGNTTPTHKNDTGFVTIFDGKTLNNWKGDQTYWRVENGCLVGEVTPETILKNNTFIIWQGDKPADFELKLEYKISSKGNSGINYRSDIIPETSFALRGYQADIDGKNKYTGQNYEEKKRTTLAYRGEKVILENKNNVVDLKSNIEKNCWQIRNVVESLGQPDTLKGKIINNDWNRVHLIIKGNRLKHYVNNILMSDVIDNDSINRNLSGYIGVQVHTGPPMKVEYRNIKLKSFN